MTKKEQQQLKAIRAMMAMGKPNTAIAKKLKLTYAGFPHRVLALLRKECNHDKYEN